MSTEESFGSLTGTVGNGACPNGSATTALFVQFGGLKSCQLCLGLSAVSGDWLSAASTGAFSCRGKSTDLSSIAGGGKTAETTLSTAAKSISSSAISTSAVHVSATSPSSD